MGKIRVTRIIVPKTNTPIQIRRKFVKLNPNRVIIKLETKTTFRSKKGVFVTHRRRK